MEKISKRLLPISRFAAYCGTTRQTLQHYDHIGLLKPTAVGEQGYRYYDALQGYDFRLINSLRRGGCSLDEVSEILNSGDMEQMQELLSQKEADLHREMQRIRQEQILLRRTAATLKFMLQFSANEPKLCSFTHNLPVLAFHFACPTRYDEAGFYETQLAFASFCAAHGEIQPYPYCFALTAEEVLGPLKRYSSIYCPYSGPVAREMELYRIPAADYVIMRAEPKGNPTDREDAYARLFSFMRAHDYRVSGESYELPVVVPKGQRQGERFPVLHAIPVRKER